MRAAGQSDRGRLHPILIFTGDSTHRCSFLLFTDSQCTHLQEVFCNVLVGSAASQTWRRWRHLIFSAGLGLATRGALRCHAGGHVIILRLQLVGRPGKPGQRSGVGQRLKLGAGQTACSRNHSLVAFARQPEQQVTRSLSHTIRRSILATRLCMAGGELTERFLGSSVLPGADWGVSAA